MLRPRAAFLVKGFVRAEAVSLGVDRTSERDAASGLPRYALPIIGRDREIAGVAGLLRGSQIVTIVGAGGIGKTRLAVEVVSGAEENREDLVWFVDLAPIGDPQLVPTAIAAAMGLELAPAGDICAALVAALKAERGLLLLDNCEHVIRSVATVVAALARDCPGIRVLATSREPLNVAGETIYRLETLDEASAIALFVARARSADPAFSPEGRNATLVREICRQLDGIALALELAAANVRVMPLGQLRARLGGRFRLVTRHRATALARHETIEALIDWSYDLLSPLQQTVFARLSVFAGAFFSEAAAAVADEPGDVSIVLGELAEKSMLVSNREYPPRYRMLESIRQYALEHLRRRDEERARRSAHAEFFLQRSADAAATFGTGTEEAWLGRYAPDLDNLRAALDWAIVNDIGLAAKIAANLAEYWEYVNLAAEGMRRSEAIFAALHDENAPQALPVLLTVAKTALAARVYRRSLEAGERALALAERGGLDGAAAEARRLAGRSRYLLGIEADRGLSDLRKALDVIRREGNAFATARAMRDYASALAPTDAEAGRRLLLEALELARTLDWPRLTIHIEINVAEREFRSGDAERAVERARDVVDRLRKRRSPVQLGHALTNLATYLAVAGQGDAALESGREAASIGDAHDMDDYVALTVQAAALVRADRGHPVTAARLLGFVDAYYDRYSSKRELTEEILQRKLLERLRQQVPDRATLERENALGRELTRAAAIALAFETG
jgi:predicted ATPase